MSRYLVERGRRYLGSFRLFRSYEEHFYVHDQNNAKLWKRITFYVAMPAVAVCMANAWWQQRKARRQERPPYVAYDYLGRHNNRFPWGDGKKSLFHSKHANEHQQVTIGAVGAVQS